MSFVMQHFKKQDEYYTPVKPVEIIARYLKPHSVIWCPFDTQESNYVKVLTREGHKVIATHICDGKDFFKGKPKGRIDYIISNPPYSKKNRSY